MAYTFSLVSDNGLNLSLIYDAATNTAYQHQKGMQSSSEITPQYHTPANDQPQLIDLLPGQRRWFFKLNIQGSDIDKTLDKLTDLCRPIDGTDQQAGRYHIDGDVYKVSLKIQPDGATNATYYDVVYGHIDVLNGLFSEIGEDNGVILGGNVELTCEPFGYGDEITLRNDLASSPHFHEDSNSDGLADGWNKAGGLVASIHSGSAILFGKQSQKLENTSGSTSTIYSDTIVAGNGVDVVAFFIVREVLTGSATVRLQDSDSPVNTYESKAITEANAFRVMEKGGQTWYWISLSATTNNTTGVRVEIALSDNSTVYVQAAYVQLDTTIVPNAWCSSSHIENRNDPDSTNENEINYIDIHAIPGDAPALLQTKQTRIDAGIVNTFYIASQSDGIDSVANAAHWIDSTGFSYSILGGGTQSTVIDSARAGGSYLRYTGSGGGASTATTFVQTSSTADETGAFMATPRRIFAIAKTSNINSTITISDFMDGGYTGESGTFSAINTWELVDLGLITPSDFYKIKDFLPTSLTHIGQIEIDTYAGAASATVDIDALLLLPVSNGFLIAGEENTGLNDCVYTVGKSRIFIGTSREDAYIGEMWTIPNGIITTRLIFCQTNTNAHALTNITEVEMTIIPRTRHLLGTI